MLTFHAHSERVLLFDKGFEECNSLVWGLCHGSVTTQHTVILAIRMQWSLIYYSNIVLYLKGNSLFTTGQWVKVCFSFFFFHGLYSLILTNFSTLVCHTFFSSSLSIIFIHFYHIFKFLLVFLSHLIPLPTFSKLLWQRRGGGRNKEKLQPGSLGQNASSDPN